MNFRFEGWTAAIVVTLLGAMPGSAPAADIGAVGNGDWSSAATWTGGVPGAANNVYIGSTYPTGSAAAATVSLSQNSSASSVYVGNGSSTTGTLDLNGFNLSANNVYLGQNGGTGAILSTAGGTLKVSGEAQIGAGSSLALGADLSITGAVRLDGTLNANGHAVSANDIFLGNNGPFTIINRGPFTTPDLQVSSTYTSGQNMFNLTPADAVTFLALYGINTTIPAGTTLHTLYLDGNGASPRTYAAVTTSAIGNVTQSIEILPGFSLALGAGLTLSDTLDLRGILNASGHAISAAVVDFGYFGGPAIFQNCGLVTVGSWRQGMGAQIQLNNPGDALGNLLLTGGSAMTVGDAAGQVTGLTVSGQTVGSISIGSTSGLFLDINGLAGGWVFRWGDPNTGDLQYLINAGEITFSYLNGGSYTITSDGSYTYVIVIPVPEPSALLLSAAAAGLVVRGARQRSKK